MSQTANTSRTKDAPQAAAGACGAPHWFPESLWPAAVSYLAGGADYLLLLGEDLRILKSNDAFQREIASASDAIPQTFTDTLTEGSRGELARLLSHRGQPQRVELLHLVRGGVRSVLYYFHTGDKTLVAFGRDQTVQLELVSQLASLVNDLEVRVDVEKERSETLKQLSERDPLTGLANRRQLERVLESFKRLRSEQGSQFSVISIDIDRFKQVNDTYGHPMGDEVLRRVAQVLERSVRDGDCVARMGGEEFMVIARGAALENAIDLGERLRAAVERTEMPEPLRTVTISVGVASAGPAAQGEPGESPDLIALADSALYAAKRAGRNRVCSQLTRDSA